MIREKRPEEAPKGEIKADTRPQGGSMGRGFKGRLAREQREKRRERRAGPREKKNARAKSERDEQKGQCRQKGP